MKQLPELLAANRILVSKQYSAGSVYMIEMTTDMIVILVYSSLETEPIYSRVYFHTIANKKEVVSIARKQFNLLKEYLLQKKPELIVELD